MQLVTVAATVTIISIKSRFIRSCTSTKNYTQWCDLTMRKESKKRDFALILFRVIAFHTIPYYTLQTCGLFFHYAKKDRSSVNVILILMCTVTKWCRHLPESENDSDHFDHFDEFPLKLFCVRFKSTLSVDWMRDKITTDCFTTTTRPM